VAGPAAGVGLLVAAVRSHSRHQVVAGGVGAEGAAAGGEAAEEGAGAEAGIEGWCCCSSLRFCTRCVDAHSPWLPGHCLIECACNLLGSLLLQSC
jgi:hypothetical protein